MGMRPRNDEEANMRAAILKAFGAPLEIEELPDPELGSGEAIVDVAAARVLPYMDEVISGQRNYALELPLAPGAGAVGRIRAVGPDATKLAVGDWVSCDPTIRSRDDALAPDIALLGLAAPGEGAKKLLRHYRHGAFAEQMRLPIENVTPLGAIDPADAAKWCALGTCAVPYGGLLAIGFEPGETLLVNGATGNFGSAGVAVALALGAARVVAAGRNGAVLADLERRFGPRVRGVATTGDENDDRQRFAHAAAAPIDCVLDMLPPMASVGAVRAAAMAVPAERPHRADGRRRHGGWRRSRPALSLADAQQHHRARPVDVSARGDVAPRRAVPRWPAAARSVRNDHLPARTRRRRHRSRRGPRRAVPDDLAQVFDDFALVRSGPGDLVAFPAA